MIKKKVTAARSGGNLSRQVVQAVCNLYSADSMPLLQLAVRALRQLREIAKQATRDLDVYAIMQGRCVQKIKRFVGKLQCVEPDHHVIQPMRGLYESPGLFHPKTHACPCLPYHTLQYPSIFPSFLGLSTPCIPSFRKLPTCHKVCLTGVAIRITFYLYFHTTAVWIGAIKPKATVPTAAPMLTSCLPIPIPIPRQSPKIAPAIMAQNALVLSNSNDTTKA
jgi:hypothetical protein